MRLVRVLLDQSLEIFILIARAYAVLAMLGTVATVLAMIWTPEPGGWALTSLVLAVTGCTLGWFGWIAMGNPEWRRGEARDPGA